MRYRVPVTLAAALVASFPASGKTPDGRTPAEETVCDDYRGFAYGLCVSYCEARDCDDPRSRAAARSCERTAQLFERRTGDPLVCTPQPDPACEGLQAVTDFRDVDDFVHDPALEPPYEIDLLDNDVIPEDAPDLEVTADDAPPEVVVQSDGIALFSPTGDFQPISFDYDVCCGDFCSTAALVITS